MLKEDEEKIEEIKKKIFRHPNATDLHIKRIPKDTVEVFKKFSNDDFVGDYGMAFKWMVDNLLVGDERIAQISAVLQNHEDRLSKIEKKGPTKVKTLMSGRQIVIPRKE